MPGTIQGLALLIVAVVPGALARAAWSRGKTLQRPASETSQMIQAIAISLVIETALAPITVALLYDKRHNLDQYPLLVTAWAFTAAIVIPLVGGYLFGRVADALTLPAGAHPNAPGSRLLRDLRPAAPSAFDWMASMGTIPDPSVIVVTFRDGKQVGGLFAEGAVLTTSPQTQGMLFPKEVVLDGSGEVTGQLVPHSHGLLVPDLTEVRAIRILDLSR
jgi:hypothetical protein